MSELSVKSTRRKFQGIFKMCLKSHFAPTALVGALAVCQADTPSILCYLAHIRI
jgi:hypothetical protein